MAVNMMGWLEGYLAGFNPNYYNNWPSVYTLSGDITSGNLSLASFQNFNGASFGAHYNSVLVFTFAETSASITDVNLKTNESLIDSLPLSPVKLHLPSGQTSQICEFGEVQAFFISLNSSDPESPARKNQGYLSSTSRVDILSTGAKLSAVAIFFTAGNAGYVSASTNYDWITGSNMGPYSLDDQSRGNGASLRFAALWTGGNGIFYPNYYPPGSEPDFGPEDFYLDSTSFVLANYTFKITGIDTKIVVIVETVPSKGNSSIGFIGPGPNITTPGVAAVCISDTWPRNRPVRGRPFNVGRLPPSTGFINSPFRP